MDVASGQKLLNSPLTKQTGSPDDLAEWSRRSTEMMSLEMGDLAAPFAALDLHLTLRSYLSGSAFSDADLIVWETLRSNRLAQSIIKQRHYINVSRWFEYIKSSSGLDDPNARASTLKKPDVSDSANGSAGLELGLQHAQNGVVVRFPPEPSGFLHIGHAKAALLNDFFAHKRYQGTLILRFDDTNPSKEEQAFEDAIIIDLQTMGIIPDKTSHTSDYFQELYDYCVRLIQRGYAYADDTDQKALKAERKAHKPSRWRDASVEDNLWRFAEMKIGSVEGQRWCIRAKIAYDNPNGALRDPTIYRCNSKPHHRTGSIWKIFPTYDFACPIIDAHEGVTHALRTTEYNDRDAQYQWMLKTFGLRNVLNWNFARLNFRRTVLSKRKLAYFVQNGLVSGWDDPRMPTIRGLKRRGLHVEALQDFLLAQGPSRNVVNQEWGSLWAMNKTYVDPGAGRYTAILKKDAVTCTILGIDECHIKELPLHARHDIGHKRVVFGPQVLIEQADAAALHEEAEVTLMNWGNVIVRRVHRADDVVKNVAFALNLQGDYRKTKKIHWLSTGQDLVNVELVDFDFLITKDKIRPEDDMKAFLTPLTQFREEAYADCNIANVEEDRAIQFDRKAYYRVDVAFTPGKPAVMFKIPTGRA